METSRFHCHRSNAMLGQSLDTRETRIQHAPASVDLLPLVRATHVIHDRHSFSERSKYVPVRLTSVERTYLRLVESVVSVMDYTGKVDADFPSASKRQNVILTQVLLLYWYRSHRACMTGFGSL